MYSENRKVAFKYTVTQEYEVVIYYENGVSATTAEDAESDVIDDVLDMAFNEDGLVVFTDEEAKNNNGFIALVTTFDPIVEQKYHVYDIPASIKLAVHDLGINKNGE